jgi:hypothetical protein
MQGKKKIYLKNKEKLIELNIEYLYIYINLNKLIFLFNQEEIKLI